MHLLPKIAAVIAGSALAAVMAAGQASASTSAPAVTSTSAQVAATWTATPEVVNAFWFQTYFTFGSGAVSELVCGIKGQALIEEFPNDIDAWDCIRQGGIFVLWLHGDDYAYGLFHG